MKNYLLIALFITTLLSCRKQEPETVMSEYSIVGNWKNDAKEITLYIESTTKTDPYALFEDVTVDGVRYLNRRHTSYPATYIVKFLGKTELRLQDSFNGEVIVFYRIK
jgi:hypothetical protein